MKKQTDWLNDFIEKNAWSIIIALVGVAVAYTILSTQVKAQDHKIESIEEAQFVIIENQKSIIQLQTNQTNITHDIQEIKIDVKEILKR